MKPLAPVTSTRRPAPVAGSGPEFSARQGAVTNGSIAGLLLKTPPHLRQYCHPDLTVINMGRSAR